MKRRSFLQALGLGAATAAIPFAAKAEVKPEHDFYNWNPQEYLEKKRGKTLVWGPELKIDAEDIKKDIQLTKLAKKGLAGGKHHTFDAKRNDLKDLHIFEEALEDIRAWGTDQVDEDAGKEIFVSAVCRTDGPNKNDDWFTEDCWSYNKLGSGVVEPALSGLVIDTGLPWLEGSGLVVTGLDYKFPTEDNFTEEVAMVGNTNYWNLPVGT